MTGQATMVSLAEEYLAYRRKLGFQLRTEGGLLLQFAKYADGSGHQGPLTEELALRWARLPSKAAPLYQARRLEIVRGFARHRAVFDPTVAVPAPGLLGSAHGRTAPHIYSEAEVSALLRAAARLSPNGGLRPRTYAALLSLLACTGLRISEALKLKLADVDWERRLLTIRETKFHKTRLVPLHASAVRGLRTYARFRDRCVPPAGNSAFFRAEHGDRLCYRTVCGVFRKLYDGLSTSKAGIGRAPRLHDFRHTFACRRLLLWYRQGTDVEHAVASLSTYLGHAKVSDTYWYLTGIPELLGLAAVRFERLAALGTGGRP
jgi:integrase